MAIKKVTIKKKPETDGGEADIIYPRTSTEMVEGISNYLLKSGGTMTGAITLTEQSSVWNTSNIKGSGQGSTIGFNTNGQIGVNVKPTSGSLESGFIIRVGDNSRLKFGDTTLSPYTNNQYNLGTSDYQFNNIRGKTIYQNGTKVSVEGHTHSQYLTSHQDISGKVNGSGLTSGKIIIGSGTNNIEASNVSLSDLVAVAEGKTKTYVCTTQSSSTNKVTALDSQEDGITIQTSFKTTSGDTISVTDLHIGDVILVESENVPDRWVAQFMSSDTVLLRKLETRNITVPTKTSDLTNDSGFITGVSWNDVTGKPSSFTPSSHNHDSSYVNLSGTSTISDSSGYKIVTNPQNFTVKYTYNNADKESIAFKHDDGTDYFIARTTNSGTEYDYTLPNASGTLALTSGTLKFTEVTADSGSPLTYAQSVRTNASTYLPNGNALIYNRGGTEWSMLFSFRSDNLAYGSVLKWGYNDTYLRIARVNNHTWQSNDWEKISAGYADGSGVTNELGTTTTTPNGAVRYNNTTGTLTIHSTATNEKIALGTNGLTTIFNTTSDQFTTPAGTSIDVGLPSGGNSNAIVIAAKDANNSSDYGTYYFGSDTCIFANSGDAGLFKIFDKDVVGGDYKTTTPKFLIDQGASGDMTFRGGSIISVSSSTDTPLRVRSSDSNGAYIEFQSSGASTFGYIGVNSNGDALLVSNGATKELMTTSNYGSHAVQREHVLNNNIDFNTVITSGLYRLSGGTSTHKPCDGIEYGQLIVSSGLDTTTQLAFPYWASSGFLRNGINSKNGNGESWQPWVELITSGNYSSYALPKSGGTLTGSLEIQSTGSSWQEGVRIHPASNGWCGIVLCETSNSGGSGTSVGTWSVTNNEGNFAIAKNGSSIDASPSLCCNSSGWQMKNGNNQLIQFPTTAGTLITDIYELKTRYNLGAFDTVSGNIITRQTGYYKFTGNEYYSNSGGQYYTAVTAGVGYGAWSGAISAYCPTLDSSNQSTIYNGGAPNGIAMSEEGYIVIGATAYANRASLNGKIVQFRLKNSYTETVVANEPINYLDTTGSHWVKSEWEKTLNLIDNLQYGSGDLTCYGYVPGGSDTYAQGSNHDILWFRHSFVTGRTYTVSLRAKVGNVSDTNPIILFRYEDGTYVHDYTSPNVACGSAYGKTYSYTFTPTKSLTHIAFGVYSWQGYIYVEASSIMLVEGDHAYPPQPFKGKVFHEFETGTLHVASDTSSNLASSAAIEVREFNRGENSISESVENAPRIGFHWSGRYWGNLAYVWSAFRFYNGGCSDYADIVARDIDARHDLCTSNAINFYATGADTYTMGWIGFDTTNHVWQFEAPRVTNSYSGTPYAFWFANRGGELATIYCKEISYSGGNSYLGSDGTRWTIVSNSTDAPLRIKSNTNSYSNIGYFANNNACLGYIGVNSSNKPVFQSGASGNQPTVEIQTAVTTQTDETSTLTTSAGTTFTAVDSITRDSNGHVLKINTRTIRLPTANGNDTGCIKHWEHSVQIVFTSGALSFSVTVGNDWNNNGDFSYYNGLNTTALIKEWLTKKGYTTTEKALPVHGGFYAYNSTTSSYVIASVVGIYVASNTLYMRYFNGSAVSNTSLSPTSITETIRDVGDYYN